MNTPLAPIPFIDGVTRPVYVVEDGRQYVLDDKVRPIYGVWVYIDEPEFLKSRNRGTLNT